MSPRSAATSSTSNASSVGPCAGPIRRNTLWIADAHPSASSMSVHLDAMRPASRSSNSGPDGTASGGDRRGPLGRSGGRVPFGVTRPPLRWCRGFPTTPPPPRAGDYPRPSSDISGAHSPDDATHDLHGSRRAIHTEQQNGDTEHRSEEA